jgi:hypothetical protein
MGKCFAHHLQEPLPSTRSNALFGNSASAIESYVGWLQVGKTLDRFARMKALISQRLGSQQSLLEERPLFNEPMDTGRVVASLTYDVSTLVMNASDQRNGLDAVLTNAHFVSDLRLRLRTRHGRFKRR